MESSKFLVGVRLKYKVPEVTQTEGFEMEERLLAGIGSMAPPAVETMGQEYVDRGVSYYEDSWY